MNDYSVINERSSENEKYERINLSQVDAKSDTNLISDRESEPKYQSIEIDCRESKKSASQKLNSNAGAKKKKKINLYAKNKSNKRIFKKRFSGGNSVAPQTIPDNQTTETKRESNELYSQSAQRYLPSPNENVYKLEEKTKYSERTDDTLKVTEIVQTTSVIDITENKMILKSDQKTSNEEIKFHKMDENGSVGSYLSAESTYAFPDSPNTESLDQILDEKNLYNFDDFGCANQRSRYAKTSMSHRDDPGFIGPVVWKMHKNYFNT